MSELDQMLEARTLIASRLLRDLVGPNWKPDTTEPNLNEKLDLGDSNPSLRYLCGYLEPRKTEMIEAKTIPELNDHDGESSSNGSEGEVSNSNNSIKDELLLSPSLHVITILGWKIVASALPDFTLEPSLLVGANRSLTIRIVIR